MRPNAAGFRGKAERQRDVELLERAHLSVEPRFGVGSQTVRPTQAGSQVTNPELSEPANGTIEPWILKMEPLADTESRGVLAEVPRGWLWCSVLAQQAQIEMAIV
jgi:hypothetical protein